MEKNKAQEIRDANGDVVGYFVPAPDFAHLLSLQEDNEILQRHLDSLLPVATPEEETEMASIMESAVPLDMDRLIREIEAVGS